MSGFTQHISSNTLHMTLNQQAVTITLHCSHLNGAKLKISQWPALVSWIQTTNTRLWVRGVTDGLVEVWAGGLGLVFIIV